MQVYMPIYKVIKVTANNVSHFVWYKRLLPLPKIMQNNIKLDKFKAFFFSKYYYSDLLINDTHREKLVFSTKIHGNTRLAASEVFHMFTQSIKFF